MASTVLVSAAKGVVTDFGRVNIRPKAINTPTATVSKTEVSILAKPWAASSSKAKVCAVLSLSISVTPLISSPEKRSLPAAIITFTSIGLSAATGAATGAVPTYLTTGGDLGATVTAGLAGAGYGAVQGGRYAMKGSEKIRLPNPEVPETFGSRLGERGMGAVRQLGERAIGSDVNEQLSAPTSPFSKLSNYLNPRVQEKEQQVAPILESGSPDEKRKAAMQLQGDASGRAVLNTASRYRYLED